MNLNQLETLIAIAQTMSFRKAGEMLNLTQPAVSAQIKSLEDEFNTILVDRTQPLSLTDSGKLFLQEAKRIMAIVEDLRLKIEDLNETPQGVITIGATPSISLQFLSPFLSYYQNQYPAIKTKIYSMSSAQMMQSVEEGSIDIGIGYLLEETPALVSAVLYYDTFELVVSPQHPIGNMTHASINVLHELPLIMLSQDYCERKYIDRALEKHQIKPQIIMELSSREEIKRMVKLNLGAAIVSKSSIEKELKSDALNKIRIREFEKSYPVGVVYKEDRYLNLALQQFIDDLKNMPNSQCFHAK